MLVDLDVAEYCTMCLHSSEQHTLFGESLLAKGPILKGIKLKRDPEVGPTRLPKKICVYVRLLCLLWDREWQLRMPDPYHQKSTLSATPARDPLDEVMCNAGLKRLDA